MRCIVLIIFFVMCIFGGGKMLFAEELSPSWERAAAQAMYDRAAEEGVLPANAFCSAEYIRQASARRREAREHLSYALAQGSTAARVWAHLFERAAARSVGGMDIEARMQVFSAKCIPVRNSADETDVCTKKMPRVAEAVSGTLMPPAFRHIAKSARLYRRSDDVACCSSINMREYSLFCAKFDAFRLYLYIESVTDAEEDCDEDRVYGRSRAGAPSLEVSSSHTRYCIISFPPVTYRVCSSSRTPLRLYTRFFPNIFICPGGFA